MEDERIRQLTAEVLGELRVPALPVKLEARPGSNLELRVAALEAAVQALRTESTETRAGAAGARLAAAHPSLSLLGVPGGGERCLLEPDKPCVESGMCRSFGH